MISVAEKYLNTHVSKNAREHFFPGMPASFSGQSVVAAAQLEEGDGTGFIIIFIAVSP